MRLGTYFHWLHLIDIDPDVCWENLFFTTSIGISLEPYYFWVLSQFTEIAFLPPKVSQFYWEKVSLQNEVVITLVAYSHCTGTVQVQGMVLLSQDIMQKCSHWSETDRNQNLLFRIVLLQFPVPVYPGHLPAQYE